MVAFSPPTQEEGFANRGMWSYFETPVGKSIVRVGGVFTRMPYPTITELEDSGGRPAYDYFLGGYDYDVTPAIFAELEAGGFTQGEGDDLTFGGGGFGTGLFGDTPSDGEEGALGMGEGSFGGGEFGS